MDSKQPELRLQFFAMIPVDSVEIGMLIYANLKVFIKTSDKVIVSGTVNAQLEECCGDKKNAKQTKNGP